MADINGTNGSDTLRGTPFDDKITTGDGDDIVYAGDGNDQINGSILVDGSYTSYASNGNKTIYGEGGNDVIIGGPGNDTLDGGPGNDRILSGGGSDIIYGGDGDDQINAFVNSDGSISYYKFSGSVTVYGGGGTDAIRGTIGNDKIDGGEGDDDLSGLAGDDLIYGGPGNDKLYGNDGNDTLDGGAGADKMYGAAGDDYYVVDNLADYVQDAEGKNTGLIKVDFYKQPMGVAWTLADGVKPLPYWIDALTKSGTGYIDAQQSLSAGVIRYAFPTSTLAAWTAADKNGFTPLNDAQKAYVQKSLSYIETLINIKFELVSDASQAGVLTFANNAQTGSGGYATGSLSYSDWGIFFNNTGISAPDNLAPKDGNYGGLTFLHEIGHALGLKHPFEKADSTGNIADAPYLPQKENTIDATVMAYSYEYRSTYPAAYGDLDIAALQYLYGPAIKAGSALHQSGDNTYTLSTASANFIWDGGGSDTLNARAANLPLVLYLSPGNQGYFGKAPSQYITDPGQITVNFGTTIENALGTQFDDKIYGNGASNYLAGGAGNDALYGLAGDDQLQGGAGDDTLDGGDGVDGAYYVGEGFTSGIVVDLEAGTVTGGAGNDRLISIEYVWGTEKDDKFYGSKGDDWFIGDAGNDYADGRDGYDTWQINNDFSACSFSIEGDVCVIKTKDLGTDRLLNIEAIVFVGTSTIKKTIDEIKAIVNSSNLPPVFVNSIQNVSATTGSPVSFSIQASDPNGDPLTYSATTATKGQVSISGSTVIYTPSASSSGTDSFVITASDGKGGQATQTINVTIAAPAPPAANAFRIVTPDGWVGTVGGSGTIIGTSGFQDIKIVSGSITLDGSFNSGGDVIRLDGNANGYSVVRTGSSAAISKGSAIAVSVPIGTTGVPIVFDDGARKLVYGNGNFTLGAQSFSTSVSAISGSADSTPIPSGASANASASVILSGISLAAGQTASIALAGTAKVVGTSANETVQVISSAKSALTFDPSFNQGGDTIILGRDAGSFTAQRSSSSLILLGPNENLTIPVGTAGLTLRFTDGDRTLVYSNGDFKIGTQAIGTTATQLLSSATTASLDVGTASSPVTLDASKGAFNFTDNAAKETNVKITGFGADDRITVTGATSSQYAFTTTNPHSNGTADLVITFNNTAASAVNSITLTEAVSANAFVSNFATAQAAIGNPSFMVFG